MSVLLSDFARCIGRLLICLWLAVAATLPSHASSLTPAVYAALEKAQNLLVAGKGAEALPQLEKLLQRTRQGSLDRAMTWQLIGHTHSDAGDDPAAIAAYQQALQQDSLPASLQRAVIGNLAQLHIRQEQFQEGLS